MALPLGKVTLLVGAGLVGSVIVKEGQISNVANFFSGALKIVLRPLRQDDSSGSTSKPKNDTLMQQINSLRNELQLLASSDRCLTIVTANQSGAGTYGAVVIVVVVGYGYVWWKGWKMTDMMFATRRGLNDACTSVAKQLETVYSSIAATKKHLSSKISAVDSKVDECLDNTSVTREDVSVLRGDIKQIGADVQSVHHVVRSLETKICRIEGKQNETNRGVQFLLSFTKCLQDQGSLEGARSSSFRPALGLPQATPSRALSLPASSTQEPPSPSHSDGYRRSWSALLQTASISGLKELYAMPEDNSRLSSPRNPASSEQTANADDGRAAVFGRTISGLSASVLTRSLSVFK